MAALMTFAVAVSMAMPAAVSLFMPMAVVIAVYVRVVCKRSCRQCLRSLVRTSGYAAVKPDSSLRQGVLRARPDAAADQGICLQVF